MKRQLTKGEWGNLKQFDFGSILVTFFLERNLKQFGFGSILVTLFLECVPLFWYQWIEVPNLSPQGPRMVRWSELMPHGGGG